MQNLDIKVLELPFALRGVGMMMVSDELHPERLSGNDHLISPSSS